MTSTPFHSASMISALLLLLQNPLKGWSLAGTRLDGGEQGRDFLFCPDVEEIHLVLEEQRKQTK